VNVTIGQLAKLASVGVETVRYYQRRGLLAVPAASGGAESGRVRRYGEEDLRRLRFIRSAQAAGFTLTEIAELLALNAAEDRSKIRAMARQRIATLDAKISEMVAAREALARLAVECASQPNDGENGCPILQAFDPLGEKTGLHGNNATKMKIN
jgi:MerR family mercuric resistance operon transcriptional regulator